MLHFAVTDLTEMRMDNMSAYVLERGGIAAITAGAFAGKLPDPETIQPKAKQNEGSFEFRMRMNEGDSNKPRDFEDTVIPNNDLPLVKDVAASKKILDRVIQEYPAGLSKELKTGVQEALEAIPVRDLQLLYDRIYKIHGAKRLTDILPKLKQCNNDVGITDTEKKVAVIAEESPTRSFVREGVDFKKVTLHEVGHALAHCRDLPLKVELVETHLAIKEKVASQFTKQLNDLNAEMAKTQWSLFNTNAIAQKESLKQEALKVREFLGYFEERGENPMVGLHEVIADFYAIKYGGTTRYPETIQKLHEYFQPIRELLEKNDWYDSSSSTNQQQQDPY